MKKEITILTLCAMRYLCRQDFERRQTGQITDGAADEV